MKKEQGLFDLMQDEEGNLVIAPQFIVTSRDVLSESDLDEGEYTVEEMEVKFQDVVKTVPVLKWGKTLLVRYEDIP